MVIAEKKLLLLLRLILQYKQGKAESFPQLSTHLLSIYDLMIPFQFAFSRLDIEPLDILTRLDEVD